MYRVTAYRKIAILDRNLKYTHRWVKIGTSTWDTKKDAIRSVRRWSDREWLKATLRKFNMKGGRNNESQCQN